MGRSAGRLPRGDSLGDDLVIFVTVGTHTDPFDRLVRGAELLALSGQTVVLQRGPSTVEAPSCEVYDYLSPSDMARWVRQADILVTHGGPASFLGAPGVPIVVPRRRAMGEHVDDHQVKFVAHIRHRAHVVSDPMDLVDAVARHPEVVSRLVPAAERRTEAFAADFGRVVERVLRRRRSVR
jgi:UDP-N-acetylglucosamine transferase subunit ALG13